MKSSNINSGENKVKKIYVVKKPKNINGVYLFCSYDLANSTAYKRDSKWIKLYEVLKGIWNERPYPIVWYQEDWTLRPFEYDDKHAIVKKIREGIKEQENILLKTNIEELEIILNDVGKLREVEKLLDEIKK